MTDWHQIPENLREPDFENLLAVLRRAVPARATLFEFFLNQLRLRKGVRKSQFEARTGLPWAEAEPAARELIARGLAVEDQDRLVPTELGWRFSNESQAIFLP